MRPLGPSNHRERDARPGKRTETVRLYLAVCAGSVIGSVLRGLCSLAAPHLLGSSFLWATLFVNVVGSFVIGFYAAITGPGGRVMAATPQRQFVMTGICGGFTTFSMFSLETLTLFLAGSWQVAVLYIAVSTATWLAAVWLGHAWASRLNRL
jgi:CrcB protein